jgi:hypothetical protein
MHRILEILNQPIVLTLITLTVGSYLFSLIAERRSRKDKLKDKAIEFLTQAGDNLNAFYPQIYRQLRADRAEVNQEITNGLGDLFATNISVQVGSQAYLNSDEFHRRYMQLLNEFAAVVTYMTELEQGATPDGIIAQIRERRNRLGDSWPLPSRPTDPSTGRTADEFIEWMDAIVNRAAALLSSHLKSVLH